MTRCLAMLLLLTAFPTWGGDPPKDLLRIVNGTTFQKVIRVEALPTPVQQELQKALRQWSERFKKENPADPWMSDKSYASFLLCADNPGIVNPGDKWERTDNIRDPSLLRRCLVYGGSSPSLWFVLYQHGGDAPHFHLLLIGTDVQGAYWSRWMNAAGLDRIKFEGVKQFIKRHKRLATREDD